MSFAHLQSWRTCDIMTKTEAGFLPVRTGGYFMSKIICDVCGTSFPETSTNCPICGCAKAPDAQPVMTEETFPVQQKPAADSRPKGGRFAQNNTRRTARTAPAEVRSNRNRQTEPQKNNVALVAVVAVLLVAIIALVGYITIKVFFTGNGGASNSGGTSQVTPSGDEQDPSNGTAVPCTEIKLSSKVVALSTENELFQISAMLTPQNTSDQLTFTSTNPEVATVEQDGLYAMITGVGYGETTIVATCGNVTVECKVACSFGTPPQNDQPTQPTVTVPDGFTLKLITYKDSGEITIAKGGTHLLYKETLGVKASDITWTTSDPAVVTVENGRVTHTGKGVATVTATIGIHTATCRVIAPYDAPEFVEDAPYTISHTDVTIAKGESFFLSLKDENGAKAQNVEWTADKEGIVEINDGKITGGEVSSLTKVIVSTEYEGITYSCQIYVKAA
ncbi:MAG: hypothetical protein E7462_01550 [Ruminococcaceae bacterium]|nr:hypothetical protein [Oscillospiraceae bacterium]